MTQTITPELVDDFPAKRWSIREYDALVEQGFFDGQRLELINGRIVEMSPQASEHSRSTELVNRYLRRVFSEQYWVRVQSPLKLQDDSEPEPDVAVVLLDPAEIADHPDSALLVVEVSDTSLRRDRTIKKKLYASNNINEYWIVNLLDRKVEIYRDPDANLGTYRTQDEAGPGQSISPVAAPAITIDVIKLLP